MRKFLLLFPLGALLLLSGCFDSPKEAVMPKWDVGLNIPLLDRQISLSEILDTSKIKNLGITDSESLKDSLYFLYVNDLQASTSIQDSVQIPISPFPDSLKMFGPAGQSVESSIVFNPDAGYHLNYAEFRSGAFHLKLHNYSPGTVNYEISLPGFRDRSTGAVLTASGSVPGGQDALITLPVQNCMYRELKIAGINDPKLGVQAYPGFLIEGKASAASNFFVNFVSEVNNDRIALDRMVGSIKKTELPYAERIFKTGFGRGIKNFQDAVDFKNVRILFNAETYGELKNMKVSFEDLSITGYDLSGDNMTNPFSLMFSNKEYYTASMIAGQKFTDMLDATNTNLNKFMLKLPQALRIASRITLDKSSLSPDSLQSMSSKDSIKFHASIMAPVVVAAKDAHYTDTVDIKLTDGQIQNIQKANGASLTLEVENHLAVGVRAKAVFLDQYFRPLFTVRNSDGTIYADVAPAAADPATGIPLAPQVSKLTIVFDKTEVNLFASARHVITDVSLRTSGSTATAFGPYVRLREHDFLKYRLYGSINYRVQDNK